MSSILAQAEVPNPTQAWLSLVWLALSLVAVLLVLGGALYAVRNWLRESTEDDGCNLLLLSEYREMVQQGQLTEEEFRKIKGRMASAFGKPPPPTRPQGTQVLQPAESVSEVSPEYLSPGETEADRPASDQNS